MTRIIGIDPGLKGGIVELTEGQVTNRMPMPLDDDGGLDVHRIVNFMFERKPDAVFIERQQSMPKQGVASTFKTGMNFGILIGVLSTISTGVEFHIVQAKTWQKTLHVFPWTKDTKERSVLTAKQRWGDVVWRATERSKKAHDGMTDAANIAWYGWQCYQKDVAP